MNRNSLVIRDVSHLLPLLTSIEAIWEELLTEASINDLADRRDGERAGFGLLVTRFTRVPAFSFPSLPT